MELKNGYWYKNNQLLAVKHNNYDCFYTVGGGVQVNETSTDAVVREVCEETGYLFSVERLVFVQEQLYFIAAEEIFNVQ